VPFTPCGKNNAAHPGACHRQRRGGAGSPVLALLCLLLAAAAVAEEVVYQHIPDASVVGTGRLSYLVWDVYDATLYAPGGEWLQDQPFALTLGYLRDLKGDAIAERSVKEMRKQGLDDEATLQRWQAAMEAIFPDVSDGTRLTGIYQADASTRFFLHDEEIGHIRDPEFGRWFFGIWLAESTSAPSLRRQLLALP